MVFQENDSSMNNTKEEQPESVGLNCVISPKAQIGENTHIGHNVIIEDNVIIGKDSYIDSNTIIRSGVELGKNAFVASNCILGEYTNDLIFKKIARNSSLRIGDSCLVRSGSIIYSGSEIGDHFQTGHQVTIRESATIGSHVSIGTLSDIQGLCEISDYVRLHSNVHIGQHSIIDPYVWIFPYVVLTNDPTPPSEELIGVHIHSFAIIATGSIILPGVTVGQDALVGAGCVVTKDVQPYRVVVGNPGKDVSDVRSIRNKVTGEKVYPWRDYFSKNMPWEGSSFKDWYNNLVSDGMLLDVLP